VKRGPYEVPEDIKRDPFISPYDIYQVPVLLAGAALLAYLSATAYPPWSIQQLIVSIVAVACVIMAFIMALYGLLARGYIKYNSDD